MSQAVLERFDVDAIRATLTGFRDLMKAHAAVINRLNVYPVPDGDTGTNMARTLDAVVAEMQQAEPTLGPTCAAISHGSLMGARGNSGVILSQILRGLVGVLQQADEPTSADLAAGLAAAAAGAYKAVLKPIEGTILTVVRAAAEGAQAAAESGASLVELLDAARASARTALEQTPEMLPVLKDAGVVDAGGAGFVLLLDSALHVVDGRAVPEPEQVDDGVTGAAFEAVAHRVGDGTPDVSELRYEVMYFLDLADERIDDFKQRWGEIGDSIVVVGGDGLWNCHVHTNDIGAAIESALDLAGRPKQIRVTDLFEEVDAEHAAREAAIKGEHLVPAGPAAAGLPPVTTAVVAVSSGDGLTELFGQLGVQGIVTGGQTLNPSTAELLDAVARVNAQQVVILPNNKNIIPVAEQIDAISDKRVAVVRTTSMPEALAALVVYDPEASAEVNAVGMTEAAGAVQTGEITQAVRDTNSDAGPITAGDWIGIMRGDGIVAVSGSLDGAATSLLQHLLEEGGEILTMVTGKDASASQTESIVGWLGEHYAAVDIEVHRGGQALYPFLFGVE